MTRSQFRSTPRESKAKHRNTVGKRGNPNCLGQSRLRGNSSTATESATTKRYPTKDRKTAKKRQKEAAEVVLLLIERVEAEGDTVDEVRGPRARSSSSRHTKGQCRWHCPLLLFDSGIGEGDSGVGAGVGLRGCPSTRSDCNHG